jgi:hypothetical protein
MGVVRRLVLSWPGKHEEDSNNESEEATEGEAV